MSHAPSNPTLDQMDDPEPGSTWFISLVSVVLMAVTVLGLVAIYFGFAQAEVDVKVVDRPVRSLQELRLSQEEILTETGTYEIENAEGETVERIRIPITDAMGLVIAEQKARTDATTNDGEAIASR